MVIALALMIEINFLELAVSSTVKLSKVEPNLFHSSKNQDVNPSCPWQGILSERGPNWFQSQATQCGTQETHLSSAGRGLRFETERQRLLTQHHLRCFLSSERGLLHKRYFYSQCSDTGGTGGTRRNTVSQVQNSRSLSPAGASELDP